MFTYIKQGFNVYIEELEKYAIWMREKGRTYGEDQSPAECWRESDYAEYRNWNYKLAGMEKVLGLTEREVSGYSSLYKARRAPTS